jgi:undecaprenyl-diphosphatase
MADDLFVPALVDVAKVVTILGTLPVAIGLVAVVGSVLVRHGHAGYALTLATGLLITFAGVHIAKGAVDRARPSDALVDVAGSSYPSGHAAYAVTWVAAAVALGRVLPNLTSRLSLVTAAVIVAAVVGLSRVYLRVHFLSDVLGGWGMAAAIYSVCGIVALIVGHVRNNGPLRA